MEYEATRLGMEEKLVKGQARVKVLDRLDMTPIGDEEDAKGRNITHDNQMTDLNIGLGKQYEN